MTTMTELRMAPRKRAQSRDLGDVIYRARRRKRWSQVDLANEAGGLSDSFISRVESGTARPSPETLRALADCLDLDFNELSVLAKYSEAARGSEAILVLPEEAPDVRAFLQLSAWARDVALAAGKAVKALSPIEQVPDEDADNEGNAEPR